MSAATEAKAVQLEAGKAGTITFRPLARTFDVHTAKGDQYTVTLGALPVPLEGREHGDVCTCEAGQHGRECYHVKAARIRAENLRRGTPDLTEMLTVLGEFHLQALGGDASPPDLIDRSERILRAAGLLRP